MSWTTYKSNSLNTLSRSLSIIHAMIHGRSIGVDMVQVKPYPPYERMVLGEVLKAIGCSTKVKTVMHHKYSIVAG